MSTDRPPAPGQYEIRVEGHLPPRWAAWFDGMSLANDDDGTTVLSGPVVDQAALHGLLRRVRDAGLPLISVTPVDADEPTPSIAPRRRTSQPFTPPPGDTP
jgi:hypothetical protein